MKAEYGIFPVTVIPFDCHMTKHLAISGLLFTVCSSTNRSLKYVIDNRSTITVK